MTIMTDQEKEKVVKAILKLLDKTYSKEIRWENSDRRVLPKDFAREVRECYEARYLDLDMLLYSISVFQEINWRSGNYDIPEVLREVELVFVDENGEIIEKFVSSDVRVLIDLIKAVQWEQLPISSQRGRPDEFQRGRPDPIDSILASSSL
jgi:hypothetical protein